MSSLDDLFDHIPTAQLAEQLGVDEDTAQKAINSVVPRLLGDLHQKTQDPDNDNTLESAVESSDPHSSSTQTLISSFLQTSDDAPREEENISTAFGSGGATANNALVQKLIPLLVPIIISYLSNKTAGSNAPATGGGTGGVLGQVIGGILSGAGGANTTSSQGGVLGDILGNVLTGGKNTQPAQPPASQGQGGLGEILGNVLNGGQSSAPQEPQTKSSGGGLFGKILGGILNRKK